MCLCVLWCVWCMKVHTYAQAVKVRCLPQLVSNIFWGLSHWTWSFPVSLNRKDCEAQASSGHHFPVTEITGARCHTRIVSHGLWGIELRFSHLYNTHFTHWAVSSARFAVVILFPKITNHISTTWAISRRWIKTCNIILLPHFGELKNRKGIAFAQGHTMSGIQTFFVP